MNQAKDRKKGRRRFLTTAATAFASTGPVAAASGRTGRTPLDSVRMIDLSVAIEHDAAGELMPPKIEYIDHAAGTRGVTAAFGCRPGPVLFRPG